MARLKKQRAKQKFNYTKDRKRSWKNKNKLAKITCPQLREAWDGKKSIEQNMLDMGLSADSNKTIRIHTKKALLGESHKEEKNIENSMKKALKQHVVESLEEEASRPVDSRLELSDPEAKYCIYMMEKYGEDYKAMARDHKNYYQETPKQIKKKINTFKNTTEQYKNYLRKKVYLSPFPTLVTVVTMSGGKRTRKYEAGRRNGHYNTTPKRNSSSSSSKADRAMSQVKRKLQFGRKPPQKREATRAASTPSLSSGKVSKKKSGKAGSRITRELRSLMQSAATIILPVRLRSAMVHFVGTRAYKGYRLKAAPEITQLDRKRSTRSSERITKHVHFA